MKGFLFRKKNASDKNLRVHLNHSSLLVYCATGKDPGSLDIGKIKTFSSKTSPQGFINNNPDGTYYFLCCLQNINLHYDC